MKKKMEKDNLKKIKLTYENSYLENAWSINCMLKVSSRWTTEGGGHFHSKI